jgi:arsenite methyltransferase
MSANEVSVNVETAQANAEQIKQGVREVYAARVSGDAGQQSGNGVSPASNPERTDLIELVGYSPDDLAAVPADAAAYSFGCGNPLGFGAVTGGDVVLDIGSGAGMDALLAARLVGPSGMVIGLDMTPEMIAKATQNAEQAGATNVEFRLGDAEQMPISDASVDWVISNCVINLAPDKRKVFGEIARVLKPGGRVAISDIVTGKLPQAIRQGLAAWAACVGGAINEDEYLDTMREVGLTDVRVIARQTYDVASVRGMIDEMASSMSLPIDLVEAVCSPEVVSQIWSARITARKPEETVRAFDQSPA